MAEQWGRRWISCDTSQVALVLARQRLITATFAYYQLTAPEAGVGRGFKYQTSSTASAKTSAKGTAADTIWYDQPLKDGSRKRISGPFTVEAVPAPEQPLPDAARAEWCAKLRAATTITAKDGRQLSFSHIEALPSTQSSTLPSTQHRYLHAKATIHPVQADPDNASEAASTTIRPEQADSSGASETARATIRPEQSDTSGASETASAATRPEQADSSSADDAATAYIVFDLKHGHTMEQRQVEQAIREAEEIRPTPAHIIFATPRLDPVAARAIAEVDWPGVELLTLQMNADPQTGDLKKQQAGSDSFWLVGQPKVQLRKLRSGPYAGKWQASIIGFDYFNTETGELTSGNNSNIALWLLDTDYDGRSLYPSQVFFPMTSEADDDGGWRRLAKTLRAEVNHDLVEYFHRVQSIPFDMGKHERIAVKIVDDRGIESLKVMPLYAPARE